MDDVVNVKDFGAVGDGVTDDAPAFQAALESATLNAIRSEFAATPPIFVPAVDSFYRIASSIVMRRSAILVGTGGRNFGGSRIVADANVTAINIRYSETTGHPDVYLENFGAQYCTVKGLRIECADTVGSSTNYGILSNATCRIVDCIVKGFGRDGVFLDATTPGNPVTGNNPDPPEDTEPTQGYFGNVDLFYVEDVTSRDNKGNGFRCLGNVANAGLFLKCDATNNSGCGYLDESSLGNTYVGCHAAANSTKVLNGGKFYVCIQVHTSAADNEPGVGVDWQDFWQEVIATVEDTTWSVGVDYLRSGSFHTFQSAGRSCLVGCYSEAGIQGPCVLAKNDLAVGGNITDGDSVFRGINRAYPGGAIALGDGGFNIRGKGRSDDNLTEFQSTLMPLPSSPIFYSWGHSSDDPGLNGYKITYSVTRGAYELVRDTNETRIMQMTTPGWSDSPFSGDHQVVFEQGAIVGSPDTGGSLARIRAFPDISSIPAGLVVTKNEFFLLTGATTTGDPTMAVVTTAGTVGTDAVIVGVSPLP